MASTAAGDAAGDSLADALASADAGELSADGGGASAEEAEGEEGKEGDAEGGDGQKKRKSGVRRRRNASELNLLRDPDDIIVELTEAELQRLAGTRKLHQLRYPTYIVCTHENFQLRDISGLQAVKGTALKELDLSHNKLMVVDALEQFSTLKTLKATRNLIAEVTIERLPRLKHLDLSYNKLDGIPDLSGFKALSHLNLSCAAQPDAPRRAHAATAAAARA